VLNFQSQDQTNGSDLWRKTLKKGFNIVDVVIGFHGTPAMAKIFLINATVDKSPLPFNYASTFHKKTHRLKSTTNQLIYIPNLKDLAFGPKGHAMKQRTLKSLAIFMEVVFNLK